MEDYEDHYSNNDEDNQEFGCESYMDDAIEEETPNSTSKSPSSSTQVITKESLLAAQRENLRVVMELLPLSEPNARILLIHHRWNVDKLLGVLVDKGRDHLLAAAGVSECKKSTLLRPSSPITCSICFEDFSSNAVTTMDCGHCFCNTCWTGYFIVKINDGQSRRITCMAPKCNAICDEAIVRNLVTTTHPEIANRFERFLLESYIDDNNKVKWCPSVPHCGNAIRIDGDDVYFEVECTCGQQFCFSCLSEAHSPCSCRMWELWAKKCRDDSETVNWITVNTKACPKCHKHVEKNGGCNLVTCFCGQSFCWVCGAATGRNHTWTNITGHTCGRYEDSAIKKSEHAKHELHRYIHYHSRYKSHLDSFMKEGKLETTIQEKISILEKRQSKIVDCSWLLSGLDRLFRSRRVLAYSYPFAFYMFGDELFKGEMTKEEKEIKKNLFEDQQQQLEFNVERLSNLLEKPFHELSEATVLQMRQNIINLSVLVDKLCLKMYECIANDLLGTLQFSIHNIAPYVSRGVERASELSFSWGSDSNMENSRKNKGSDASLWQGSSKDIIGVADLSRHGSLKRNLPGISQIGCSARKRSRKDAHGDGLIDFNMPP